MSIDTTIAAVISGQHEEDTEVTVTGRVNSCQYKTALHGSHWVIFKLFCPVTALDVLLYPAQYTEFEGILGPSVDDTGGFGPPVVTITGHVYRHDLAPGIRAMHVVRVTPTRGPGLAKMRASSEALDARPDFQEALRLARSRPVITGPGVDGDIVLARLRGEEGGAS